MNNATPPKGHDWGERTRQSVKHKAPGYWRDDAWEIRRRFGIPKFDPTPFFAEEKARPVYPDLVIHERNPRLTMSPRGTDALVRGKRGCGKSTLAAFVATRTMEDPSEYVDGLEESNANKVIWRGSPERSEWLRLRKWATLFLPKHARVDADWMLEGESRAERVDDLEDVVRSVKRYEGITDLLDQLGEQKTGTFNVVYPDPSFSGCTAVTEETERVSEAMPYTPKWNSSPERPATPLTHWWFAFWCARVEYGPFEWWTMIFDELGDLVPERAKQDDHRTYDKIGLLRSVMADSRRAYLSIFAFCHYEENLHHDLRREFKWRIHMPDGSPNPRKSRLSSIPVGFETVKMNHDIMSHHDVGTALCYNESSFTKFGWEDIPGEPDDADRWLRIKLRAPESELEKSDEEADSDEEKADDSTEKVGGEVMLA